MGISKLEKGKLYRYTGLTGLSNWSIGTSFEPCSPLVNELAEIYDKAVAGEATEKDVERFFDMLIGRKRFYTSEYKGPFTLGKMDVSNDLLSKLIMELKSMATLKKSNENLDAVEKFFAELTKPNDNDMVDAIAYSLRKPTITAPDFFCDNEGKVESKPWKPQYNEKVLYKFRKDSKFREGIYVGKNPLFSQENNYPHVVICNTSDPIKACEIKPLRNPDIINGDIESFVETMKEKLSENSYKPLWGCEEFAHLFGLLQEEVRELGEELIFNIESEGKCNNVMREAADVGNFAMMIHANAKRRMNELAKEEKKRRS